MADPTPESLEQAFRIAEAAGAAGPGTTRRRLDPEAGLVIFTEVRFPERDWALVVQSHERLQDQDLVLAAGLTCRTRDGRIEVIAGSYTERRLFCTLLADLLSQLPHAGSGPAAALARRLTAWQRMLSRGLLVGLSPEKRAGLYGELLAFRDLILPSIGPDAVRAWTGPSGAPHDFAFLSAAAEVKTVSPKAAGSCRISSEQQLDTTHLSTLFLIHQSIGLAPEGAALAELIDELRGDPRVRADRPYFENALLEYGWLDVYRAQYKHERYALNRRRCFAVRDGFPRLIPAALPIGVSGLSYLLDLSECGQYQVDDSVVRHSLAQAADAAEGR